MTIVVTSYTPTTGPQSGGTTCVVTGTGLDTCTTVLVGGVQATIVGTPTPTSLTFLTPAQATAAAMKVGLYDGTSLVQATTSFTYTAVPATDSIVTQLAKTYRIDCRVPGTSTWFKIRGIKTVKSTVPKTSEDDSDFDSGDWGQTLNTLLNWQLAFTCKRGRGLVSGTYDPGQEIIHACEDKLGSAGIVEVRWYVRDAKATTDEAYQGLAQVTWAPQGGAATANLVDVTLDGQGARTKISNPVIADPTLT